MCLEQPREEVYADIVFIHPRLGGIADKHPCQLAAAHAATATSGGSVASPHSIASISCKYHTSISKSVIVLMSFHQSRETLMGWKVVPSSTTKYCGVYAGMASLLSSERTILRDLLQ